MRVEPALRQVVTAASAETLQPRAMQVLVALARANGAIVSRDALVRQCWEGRIVGDDSINRIISRLRRLATERGDESFGIETITKVGYRLTGARAEPIESAGAAAADGAPRQIAPARSHGPRAWAVALAVAVLVVAGGWFGRGRLGLVEPPRQVVAVESFDLGPGVSTAFAKDVRAEIIDFLANDRFYAVDTAVPADARHADSWHVRGRLALSGDRMIAFAQLLKPGSEAAVFALRIDRDARQAMLARSLGLRIGRTAGCVMLDRTDPELTGGYVDGALPQLASSCVTWHDKTTTQAARMDAFRDNVTALPKSAYFRARLAEMLGDRAAGLGADAPNARAEGLRLVAQATAIDPAQPHILLAQARLRPASDFAGREALLRRALAARPSDCACEFGDYAGFLLSVGRTAEARRFASRAQERQPKNIPWMRLSGEAAAKAGAYDVAKAQLTQVAGYFPDPGSLDDARLALALWSSDWRQAKSLVLRQPPGRGRDAWITLIGALASGNDARIRAGSDGLAAPARSDAGVSRMTVVALGMGNRPLDAIAAAARWLDRNPLDTSVLFEPSFAPARRTPAFAGLVARLGLLSYWRTTKTQPDFCAGANAPPVCRTI